MQPNSQNLVFLVALALLSLVAADCNIDSAGVSTYSTSDGLIVSRVGVVATFRLGCSQGTTPPVLHGETAEGQYLTVSTSTQKSDFREVSFTEDVTKSKSRWIEIKIFDDDTYKKLADARQSGASQSYYKPIKTISVSHYGVSGGPFIKMETFATLALVGLFLFAHNLRSKIVS